MKKTTLSLAGIALAAAFSLTACGGADEEKLAQEYCDLAQDASDAVASGDPEQAQDAADALTQWAEDNKDARGDEDAFTDAIEEKCGDLDFTP